MKAQMTNLMIEIIGTTLSNLIVRPEITILSNTPSLPLLEDLSVTQTFIGDQSGWLDVSMELFTGINLAEASLQNIHIDELEEAVFLCLSRLSRGIAQELAHASDFADQNLQFNPPCFDPASRKRLAVADKYYLDVLVQGIGQLRLTIGLKPAVQPPKSGNNIFACSGF